MSLLVAAIEGNTVALIALVCALVPVFLGLACVFTNKDCES